MTKPGGFSGGYWRDPPKPFTDTQPHAILDSSHRVIAIRNYPSGTKSRSVIPIPDGMDCQVGWVWKHSKFCPPTQET